MDHIYKRLSLSRDKCSFVKNTQMKITTFFEMKSFIFYTNLHNEYNFHFTVRELVVIITRSAPVMNNKTICLDLLQE